MKQLYIAFLLFVFQFGFSNKNLMLPGATISGPTAVCQGATGQVITFTGSGGNAPYTFTYTLNGNPQPPITTTTGNSVTLPIVTSSTGQFTYNLVSVQDSSGTVNLTLAPVIVNVIPPFTVSAGSDILICKGNSINLSSSVTGNGANPVTFSWSGPNGYTSNLQSPIISNSTGAMSGNYTVTGRIGNCTFQDVVNVTVLEPTVSSVQLQNYDGTQWIVKCTDPGATSGIVFISNGLAGNLQSHVTSYSIDWGDVGSPIYTSTSASWSTNHSYNIGLYTLIVSINTDLGCVITRNYTVFVGNQPASPQMQLPPNAQGCAPFDLTFPISGVSGNVPGTTYTITFSDDPANPLTYTQFDIPASITRSFSNSSCGSTFTNGTNTENNAFGVSIRAQNPCGSASSSAGPIRTSSTPTAIFSIPVNGCINQVITTNNQSINGSVVTATQCNSATGRYWEITPLTGWTLTSGTLGDNGGFPSDYEGWNNGSLNLGIQFTALGSYTIRLIEKNSCAQTSIDTQTICIEPPLTPLFTVPTTGCAPFTFSTTNNTSPVTQCSTPSYTWSVTFVPDACGTGIPTIPNQTTTNANYTFTQSGVYTITLTASNSCTPARTTTQTVTVQKPPTVAITAIPPQCQNVPFTPAASINGCPDSSIIRYLWTFTGGNPVSAATATAPPVSYPNTGNYTISLEVENSCGTTTATSNSFAVQPAPTVQNETTSVCSGVPFSVTPLPSAGGNTIPSGTIYSWGTPSVTGGITGGAAGTNQTSIGGTLINPTNLVQTATYTVTPKFGTCTGATFTVTVTVNPSPVVIFSPTPQTLCSGDTSVIVTLSSIAAATLDWTVVPPAGITGITPTSGSNTIPAQTLTNSTNAPIAITYNASATTSGSSTCAGALYPYTIIVKPSPRINENFTPTVCSGQAFSVTPANSALNTIPTGTTYTWSTPTVTGGMTGGATGNAQTVISGTLTNPTDTAQTATYLVTPTTNGCIGAPFTITVTVNPKPFIVNVTPAPICSGSSFTVTPTNGAGNIVPAGTTFTWTVSANANVTGESPSSAPGITTISQTLVNNSNSNQLVTYTVTPVSGGCPGNTFTITVSVNPEPIITNVTPAPICSGNSFTVNPGSIVGNIVPTGTTYTWSIPVSNPVGAITGGSDQITGVTSISQALINSTNAPATLTYTVTPLSGSCAGNPFTVVVTVNPTPAGLSLTNQIYCNGATTIPIVFSNAVIGTTYAWSNSNTGIGLGATGTGDIPAFTPTNTSNSPLVATLSVVATANGCSGPTETFTITVNPAPTVLFSPAPQSICSGGSSLPVTLSSTITGATFNWTVTPQAGITGITATSGTNTIPAETLTNTTNAPITITYNATATTASGSTCPGSAYSYTIVVNPIPAVVETFNPSICSNAAFTIIPDGTINSLPAGTTYSWNAPAVTGGLTGGASGSGQSTIAGTLNNPSNTDQTATYIVTPSSNGCTGSPFTFTVIVNPKPALANVIIANICSDDTFAISPANGGADIVPAGTTYSWTVASNPNVTGQSSSGAPGISTISQTLTNISSTNQTLIYTVTPVSGTCTGNAFTITVTVNPKPLIANATPAAICSGDTFSFTPADGGGNIVPAGTTYTWGTPVSNPVGAVTGGNAQAVGVTTISQVLTNTTNDIATLTYTVTPISGSCGGTPFTVTITLSPLPVINPQSTTICSANSFTISPTGGGGNIVPLGTTYTWATPVINPPGAVTGASSETLGQSNISQSLTNTTTNPATVTYTVTPASGSCVGSNFTVTVTVNPSINPNVTVTNNACFGVNIAEINTNITGGIPPYVITWTGPNSYTSSAADIFNLVPGTYHLHIGDQGNCPFDQDYVITEPTDIIITVDSENDISCFDADDGSIAISVTGGTGSYSYQWSHGETTQDVANLAPGTYTVSVSDANNCGPKTATFTITEPPLLVVSLVSQTNIQCYGAFTGAITVAVTGGTLGTGYSFAWTGPGTYTSASQNLSGIPAGNYQLTVTDTNNCQEQLNVTLTQNPEIIIAYTTTPITCYGANNASLNVTLSGGVAPYQFTWSNLATSLNQSNLSAGNYTITVTDNLGCVRVQTINIPDAPVFTVNPIVSNVSCFGANNGSINLNLTGGIAPLALSWADGSTAGLIRNNLPPGTYTATISDGTPCYINRTFTIVQPQPLVLSANTINPLGCTVADSGSVDLTVSGGTPPFTYSWSNGATSQDIGNLTEGNYAVNVTDANGCTAAGTYTIIRPAPLQVAVTTNTAFDCALHEVTQSFVAQASGGLPPYQYQWSSGTISGANNEIMQSDVNGTIILTVTDSRDCTTTYSVNVDNPVLGYASFDATSYGHTTYGIYSIGDPIQFTSTLTGDYESIVWDFGDGTFSSEENPVHTYLIERDYVVTQTVTYPFGCVYIQTITLTVEKGYIIVVPTAFTPNNDSLNDRYRPFTKRMKNVTMDIYDTWGSLIYSETGDVLVGWDGKIKGFNAENGNYYSRVKAETFYGTLIKEDQTFVLIK